MRRIYLIGAAIVALATPAAAEVKATTTQGFEVLETASVAASPANLYQAIVAPGRWWNAAHTFSGSSANLSLDPRAGGCFCEALKDGGSVQHMTVVYAAASQMLRLRGALGPLQGEGVDGALTFAIKPDGAGSILTVDYVVGGYLRRGSAFWAPLVDEVLAEQTGRLKRYAETGSPDPAKL